MKNEIVMNIWREIRKRSIDFSVFKAQVVSLLWAGFASG